MLMEVIRRSVGLPAFSSPVACKVNPKTSLLRLHGADDFRLQDSLEGVQIFGGTGSGKSSGSGQALALAYMRAGFGGIVLCAKPDEAARWDGYARKPGRVAHLLRFSPEGPHNFNFLDYEVHRPDGAGGETFNVLNLLLKVIEAAQLAEGPRGGGENPFWQRALREMLANTVEPLLAARGTLRLDEIMQFIASAPTSPDVARSEQWRENSFFYQALRDSIAAPLGRPVPEHASRTTAMYWFKTYAELDPRTRSNIVATLTSTLAPFLRGVLRERFCTTTDIIPELTHEGAILIVDFPVKQWGEAAVVAANIIKYQWQRATERRTVGKRTRPVFLWADECQFFLSDYDAEFQSTARSARAATVYITQNLPTYYSRLKSVDPKATANALLGNFQTKIFHANTDPDTNQYAADMIGKDVQRRQSGNWSANTGRQVSETATSNWSVNVGRQFGRSLGRNWSFNASEQESENRSSNWSRQTSGSRGTNWGRTFSTGSSSGHGGSSHSSSSGGSHGGQESSSWSRSTGGGFSTGTSSSQGYGLGGNESVNSGNNFGSSHGGGASQGRSTSFGNSEGGGWSEQMDYVVQPRVFAAELRKGGKAARRRVDGVIVQGGRRFRLTGAHWMPCIFKQ